MAVRTLATFGFDPPTGSPRVASFGYYDAVYPGAPLTPEGLTGVALSTHSIQLTWDFTPDASWYQLQRSIDGSTWEDLTPVQALTLIDTGLVEATTYHYRIRATNFRGESPYSAPIIVDTLSNEIVNYPEALNILPVDNELAFLRSVQDERVEMLGLPCKIYRWQDAGRHKRVYSVFDEAIVENTTMPAPIVTHVVLETYQEQYSRTGEYRGREIQDLPLLGMFRFVDRLMKNDLVEIDWKYAQASGRLHFYSGAIAQPIETLPTRYKLTDRRMNGINGDMTNKFALTPTEETWP